MPVHRCVGLLSSCALPVIRISLPVGPYSFSSRFGFDNASDTTTGCSPPAGVCFHSSRKNSGGRVTRGAAAPRPRAGSCALAEGDNPDASRAVARASIACRVMGRSLLAGILLRTTRSRQAVATWLDQGAVKPTAPAPFDPQRSWHCREEVRHHGPSLRLLVIAKRFALHSAAMTRQAPLWLVFAASILVPFAMLAIGFRLFYDSVIPEVAGLVLIGGV